MKTAHYPRSFDVLRLGLVEYQEAWDLQRRLAAACHEGDPEAILLLLEHPPTYTLGRGGDPSTILIGEHDLASLGAKVYHSDRGGNVTFHGPGQLVGYPIVSLHRWQLDVHRYLRLLEEVLIGVAADFGLTARRIAGLTGVWVGDEKLVAMGVKVSRGVTTHGFALNVSTDLSYFDHIYPCGLRDRHATSLAKLLGKQVKMDEAAQLVIERFAAGFEAEVVGDPRESKRENDLL